MKPSSFITTDDPYNPFRKYQEPVQVKLAPLDGLGVMLAETYINQNVEQLEMSTMTLLIPDRDRENQIDFVWCLPIERVKWNKWYGLSQKFKTATPKAHGAVRYVVRMEGTTIKTLVVMPNGEQSDDDAMTACAYLRLVKGITCRMFVVRCTDDPLRGARLIERAAGANVEYVEDMDLEGDDG